MYQIILSPRARKEYIKLETNVQKRISNALRRLRFNPERYVTKLVGFDSYRLRVGNYRVILDIEKNKLIITVIEIRHRKNIYKRML